ncbi:alpha/beta fold hydrolase [Nonomuraea jiangxiensis]|uniref:Pimeloyl-ACP methyl ester carboxylesterase n=1 Tax=Nonomuraea jiangxiensis TaxID=633440 RepID=A0A1G9B3Q4_9ACTN|nr:alpha/beta hydrolase [Nonomuraea jiangxiensis]SDK34196.1 Pimeloyl-ACP methyl ester carboxylesterase [Nonomuraea jiangxiensis]
MTRARIGRFTTPAAQEEYGKVYTAGMAALPPPARTCDVDTGFGRVRVYGFGEDGDRPPIVLLHGRAATSVMWLPNLAALAERRRVYAVDLLGEGGLSVQTAPIRHAGDQAAWLDTVLERLGIGAAHLVGVSIGGWLACNQAVRAAARVASITLLEPAATLARLPLAVLLRTIPVALPVIAERALPGFLRWTNSGDSYDEDDPVAKVIEANLRLYRTALPPPARFTDGQLRSIAVPALVVIGGRSVMHDPGEAYERARAFIPGVQAELWPHATHALAGQCAAEVNARILRFLDEQDG